MATPAWEGIVTNDPGSSRKPPPAALIELRVTIPGEAHPPDGLVITSRQQIPVAMLQAGTVGDLDLLDHRIAEVTADVRKHLAEQRGRHSDMIVYRPAPDLPPEFMPAYLDGRWDHLSAIPHRFDLLGAAAVAVATGRFELRDDGVMAEVYEVRAETPTKEDIARTVRRPGLIGDS